MMNQQLKQLISQIEANYKGSRDDNIQSLKALIETLSDMVDSLALAKVKTHKWKFHSQTLVTKIIFTSCSILELVKGYRLSSCVNKEMSFNIIDYQSMFILTRSLIENYLTLCYIYYNDLSEEEKIFRYKLWEIAGLTTRQTISSDSKYSQANKEKEKVIIEKVISEIEVSEEYVKLNRRQKDKLTRYGLARLESWTQLIEQSHLKDEIFKPCYAFFSEYVHSDYLSILQLGQINMNAESKDIEVNINISLSITRMINCLSIEYYSNTHKDANLLFKNFPIEIQEIVRIWASIAKTNS